jgi:hypothetical protein
MPSLELKPRHKPVQTYYTALRQFDDLGVGHEGAVKTAFHGLLDHCARQHDWTERIPNSEVRMTNGGPMLPDRKTSASLPFSR